MSNAPVFIFLFPFWQRWEKKNQPFHSAFRITSSPQVLWHTNESLCSLQLFSLSYISFSQRSLLKHHSFLLAPASILWGDRKENLSFSMAEAQSRLSCLSQQLYEYCLLFQNQIPFLPFCLKHSKIVAQMYYEYRTLSCLGLSCFSFSSLFH